MRQPQIKRYLYGKAAANHTPISGTFELTPCCNMNCRMCYIRLSKAEQERTDRLRSAKEWMELGEVCRDAGMLFLLLTGGEPFLREDFREIYEYLYDLGLRISVNTNGTLITEDTVAWLEKRPPEKINVTLYGGFKETYRELCGYEAGYERAVRAILLLRVAGISVSINATYTQENEKDMEQIYGFAKEHNLPVRMTAYMFPPIRKREGETWTEESRPSAKDAGHVMWKSMQLGCTKESWAEKREKLLSGVRLEEDECPKDEKMRCMAGRSAFWITWNWNMRACGTMTAPSLPVTAEHFGEVWNNLEIELERYVLPQKCSTCRLRPMCVVCGAAAQAEGQGDMSKTPYYICEMMEAYEWYLLSEKN